MCYTEVHAIYIWHYLYIRSDTYIRFYRDMSKDFKDIHKHLFINMLNHTRPNFNLILLYTFSNKLVLQIRSCFLKTNRQWQNQLVSKITVFWDVTPCNFGTWAYSEDGRCRFLWNTGLHLPDHMMSYSGRQ